MYHSADKNHYICKSRIDLSKSRIEWSYKRHNIIDYDWHEYPIATIKWSWIYHLLYLMENYIGYKKSGDSWNEDLEYFGLLNRVNKKYFSGKYIIKLYLFQALFFLWYAIQTKWGN